jgi:autotransporter-associated beta strand protein/T5SS/PEP-CTERM-associated repeat protein
MKTSNTPINSKIRRGLKLGAAALIGTTAWAAAAADINWTAGTDSYTNTANWTGGLVPGVNDNAINDNGSNNAVQINPGNPDWTVNQLQAGSTGAATGAFQVNGQTVTLVGTNPAAAIYHTSVRLGLTSGSTGVLTVTNGTLNYSNAAFNIGELGTGVMNVSGGLVTGSGSIGVNYGSSALPTAVNATVGGGVTYGDFTWFEQGYYTPNTALGLPAAGSTIVSSSQSDHSFTFAPSYAANDTVLISTNVTTATITLVSPAPAYGLSFMGSAGHGPVVINYTLHFADSTTESGTISVLDWFPPANLGSSTNVMVVGGRVDALGVNFQTPTGNPQLLSQDVVVTNSGSAINSIDLQYVSGGVACIMAVSQQTTPGGAFAPLAFTGYNKDVVVEAGYNNYVSGSVTSVVNQTGGAINIVGGGQLFVGNYGNGVYNLSGGSVDVHNYIALGRSSGNGTLNMTGGSFNQDGGGNLLVGTGYQNVNGTPAVGVLNQSGGTINSIGQVLVPENSPSMGTYNLSGPGSLNVSNWFVIGRQGGSGVLTISNNATINKTSGGDFIVCDGDGSYSGSVTMDSGTFNVNNWFRIGNGKSVQATFVQNGGALNVNGQFLVPDHGDGTTLASYTMTGAGASLSVNDWLAVGRGGAAGTLTISNGAITKIGGSGSHLDVGAGGVGVFNQEGGAVTNITSDTWIGESSDGTYNLDGGVANLSVVHVAQGGTATGTLNINGGTLLTREITTGNTAAPSYLNLNGGVIQASADSANFIHDLFFVNLYAGGVTIDSQGYNIVVPQAMPSNGDGSGGITKLGTGALTLAGANSYTGPTVVSAGTLATTTDSTGGGDYSLADNAALSLTVKNANAQLNAANLNLASSTAAALNLDLGAFGNPMVAPINVSGNLAVNGVITVNLADALPNYGQFPLIQYGSISGSGAFVLGNLPQGVGAYLSNNVTAMSIDLIITNVNLPRWQGLAGGDWDIGLTTNWVNIGDGMPTFYAEGNQVLFDDNAQGTTTVNLTTTVNPNGVTVDNSSLSYAIGGAGKISGPAGLTKQGSGTLVITNTSGNDYTGATVLSGGVLEVKNLANGGSPSAIGAATADPANLVLSGGALEYSGPAASINRGYSVTQTNGAIITTSNLTLTGVATADSYGGFNKAGAGQLTYQTVGNNLLSGSSSQGYIVQSGTVLFDGSNGNQTNTIQGTRLGVNDPAGNALVVLTNTTVTLGGNVDLGNVSGTMGNMIVGSNSTLNVGSYFIFGDGGNGGGTFTLNGGTVNVPSGQIVMGGNLNDMSTLNLNSGVFNALGGNFNIANAGWNTAGVRTGVVNQVGGTLNVTGETWIGQATDGHGFYNLHGGVINAHNWFVVGRNGSVGNMIMDGGVINKSDNGDFLVGDGGGSVATMNMTNATINVSNGSFTVGHAGATGTMNQNGGTINITAGEYWVAENGSSTNNISGAAVINVPSYVTIGRGTSTGVVNMSGGTFTQTGSNPFIVGLFGNANGIWNQTGGSLNVAGQIWIAQGNFSSNNGTLNLSGGATITNGSWLAVGREGGYGVLNINGGTYVRSGAGGGPGGPNVSIAHGGGTGTVTLNSGYVNFAAGDVWIGEDSNVGTWNQNGGTAINSYVQLARNASATGYLFLNGGVFAASEITAGSGTSAMNFNGGTLLATTNNANFLHGIGTVNVMGGGAVIDNGGFAISIAQPLLNGGGGGGLTNIGSGTLYLNGANTYTNVTQVNAGALGGTGSIAGSVAVAAGGRLSPGGVSALGTLTVSGDLSLATGSSTAARISGVINDAVTVAGSVSYDGTLVVTNAGASPLVVGAQFQLFNAGSHTGNFANAASVSILPAGTGSFDPNTGKLTITSTGAVAFNPVKVSGGNLILTGSGGAAPGSAYTLLMSTNVATPLSQWETNTTGVLDGSGMFSNNIPVNTLDRAKFFDVRVP